MAAYAMAHLDDPAPHPEVVEYLERIQDTLDPYDGRFLVHGPQVTVLEGDWPGTVVVIEFPDLDAAVALGPVAWLPGDPPAAHRNIDGVALIVDGVPEGHDLCQAGAFMRRMLEAPPSAGRPPPGRSTADLLGGAPTAMPRGVSRHLHPHRPSGTRILRLAEPPETAPPPRWDRRFEVSADARACTRGRAGAATAGGRVVVVAIAAGRRRLVGRDWLATDPRDAQTDDRLRAARHDLAVTSDDHDAGGRSRSRRCGPPSRPSSPP